MPAASASAQSGFRLDTLVAAETPEDGLTLQIPSTLGHLRWSAQLQIDYAREPLASDGVIGTGDPYDADLVQNRLGLQAVVALGLGSQGEIFLRAPATLYQNGGEPRVGGVPYPRPATGGFGDLSLGGSYQFFGSEEGFSAGAHGSLWLPSGSQASLSGDGGVGLRAGLSLMYKGRATALAFQSGAHYRPENDYGLTHAGTQWFYRAGMYVWLRPALRMMVELDGAMRVSHGQAFETAQNAFEGLLGLRYGEGNGLFVTVAAGVGLLSMAGTPLARGVVSVGWAADGGR